MRKNVKVALLLGALALGGGMAGCGGEKGGQERAAGDKAYKAEKWQEAADAYGKSLALNPTNDKSWFKRGNALMKLDQHREAAEAFGKVLEIDPKNEKAYDARAMALMKAGDMPGATATILKTLEFKQDAAAKGAVYRNLANLYMAKQDIAAADEYFVKALEANPKDDQALSWRAELASQLGGARSMQAPAVPEQLERALGLYDQVIALKPDEPVPYLNKRIVMAKYMTAEKAALEEARVQLAGAAKNKTKAAELQQIITQHEVRLAELKGQFDTLTKKFAEVQKAKAAAAPAAK
jgi:tetratricopeptide (TPR) repeat protein